MEENRRNPEQLFSAVNQEGCRKGEEEKTEHLLNTADIIKSVGMIILASAIGFGFWKLGMSESNIIMVYIQPGTELQLSLIILSTIQHTTKLIISLKQ